MGIVAVYVWLTTLNRDMYLASVGRQTQTCKCLHFPYLVISCHKSEVISEDRSPPVRCLGYSYVHVDAHGVSSRLPKQ